VAEAWTRDVLKAVVEERRTAFDAAFGKAIAYPLRTLLPMHFHTISSRLRQFLAPLPPAVTVTITLPPGWWRRPRFSCYSYWC
jgi:hypothetical protein